MTATTTSRADVLAARLRELRAERDLALGELAADGAGDVADRATNVDANVRYALLEQRIQTVEVELTSAPASRPSDGSVGVGDVVTLDLGDGPETFLFGSVEQFGADLDVVTPGSPLGTAIDGAAIGSTVSYVNRGRELAATIVEAR